MNYPIREKSWSTFWYQSVIHFEIHRYRNLDNKLVKKEDVNLHHITLKREFSDEKPQNVVPQYGIVVSVKAPIW